MSNWIKFSDRLPTEKDFAPTGELIILGEEEIATAVFAASVIASARDLYSDCYWLEGVPSMPKPRTLEDVVREYIEDVIDAHFYTDERAERGNRLIEEMKEIVGRKDNG